MKTTNYIQPAIILVIIIIVAVTILGGLALQNSLPDKPNKSTDSVVSAPKQMSYPQSYFFTNQDLQGKYNRVFIDRPAEGMSAKNLFYPRTGACPDRDWHRSHNSFLCDYYLNIYTTVKYTLNDTNMRTVNTTGFHPFYLYVFKLNDTLDLTANFAEHCRNDNLLLMATDEHSGFIVARQNLHSLIISVDSIYQPDTEFDNELIGLGESLAQRLNLPNISKCTTPQRQYGGAKYIAAVKTDLLVSDSRILISGINHNKLNRVRIATRIKNGDKLHYTEATEFATNTFSILINQQQPSDSILIEIHTDAETISGLQLV